MLRRSRVGMGLTMGAAVVVLAACGSSTKATSTGGSSGGAKSITIAYLQKQGDQSYFVQEAQGAKQEAAKLGNVKINVANLMTDSNLAINDLNAQLGQQVNGVVIVVPDQKIGPQVISAAQAAHVPLAASDDPIMSGGGAEAPFVGFDSLQMGTKVGGEAGTLFKQSGWTPSNTKILAAYQQGLSDCQLREQGAEQGFKQMTGANVPIVKVGTDNSVVGAENQTGAALTANQGVQNWIVWGCNDENETGVVTAMQNAGVSPSHINGVGLGAYLTCKDWQANKVTGNKASLWISGADVGAVSVQQMVAKIRNNTPLPAKTVAPSTIVTAQNFKQAGVVCSG